MGADLYIEMVFEPSGHQWGNGMHCGGHFRDSYNSSNVLWQFGLSWWKDVIPMLDEQSNLTVAQAETLLEMLHEREPVFEKKLAQLSERERQDFHDRANELQMFLQMAIRQDSPIHCSL